MFKFVKNKINAIKLFSKNNEDSNKEIKVDIKLTTNIDKNISIIKEIMGLNKDFIIREFFLGERKSIRIALFYIDGMVEKTTINQSILKPLMYDVWMIKSDINQNLNTIETIKKTIVSVGDIELESSINLLIESCLTGNTVMLVDKYTEGLVISTAAWVARAIEEPKTEVVVRGPREGFTENITSNTVLIRRKICDPNLIFEAMKIGVRTKTKVAIAYINGIVDKKIVDEVKLRLGRIKIDAVLESGYIEQLIEDAPFSLFTTVGNSEKPDVVAAKMLEGRVAIITDGTPIVLTVPMLFGESFHSSEDYYSRPYYMSFVRIIRYLSLIISIFAPSVFVALTTFHQEVIPTPLFFTMAVAREGTPFPAMLEAFVMIVTFEILREAGVRLPRPVGQAISIVGALVIGEATVQAGIVSSPMVIVVALTAIASFISVVHGDSASILRLIFIIIGGILGAYGITIGLIFVLVHLTSLRSFGIPYFAPFAPFVASDLKDSIIRAPLWLMNRRPYSLRPENSQREKANSLPQKQ